MQRNNPKAIKYNKLTQNPQNIKSTKIQTPATSKSQNHHSKTESNNPQPQNTQHKNPKTQKTTNFPLIPTPKPVVPK